MIEFKLILESHRAVQFASMIRLSLHSKHLASGEIITWRLHEPPQVTHCSRICFSTIGQGGLRQWRCAVVVGLGRSLQSSLGRYVCMSLRSTIEIDVLIALWIKH